MDPVAGTATEVMMCHSGGNASALPSICTSALRICHPWFDVKTDLLPSSSDLGCYHRTRAYPVVPVKIAVRKVLRVGPRWQCHIRQAKLLQGAFKGLQDVRLP